jgi:hypothetical protein
MFKDFLETIKVVYFGLSNRVKLIILSVILGLVLLSAYIVISRRSANIVEQAQSTLLADIRARIEKLGNPFQLTADSLIAQYPFIIFDKVKDNAYVIEVNTTMLLNSYYDNLFAGDESIKRSLQGKPVNYIDTYQMFFDSNTNMTTNPYSRMTNFNKVTLNGEVRWFMEEGDDYWISDAGTDLKNLKKVNRPKNVIPPFRKLIKIGENKFLSTQKDEALLDLQYITFEVFPDASSRTKAGKLNYSFLDEPVAPADVNFTGAIAAAEVLPTVYPINGSLVLQKSLNAQSAVFTFVNISDVETPQLLREKQFNIKELNSIYVTCSSTVKEKCWIYNPGLKTVIEVNNKAEQKRVTATLDVDLTKMSESLAMTFDKDKLLRYNEESDELLFFYQSKWRSVLRF